MRGKQAHQYIFLIYKAIKEEIIKTKLGHMRMDAAIKKNFNRHQLFSIFRHKRVFISYTMKQNTLTINKLGRYRSTSSEFNAIHL